MKKTNKKEYSLDFGITAFLKNGRKIRHLYCKSLDPQNTQQKITRFENTVVIEGKVPEEIEIVVKDSDNKIVDPFVAREGAKFFSSWNKLDVEIRDKKFKTVKTFHVSRVKEKTMTKVKVQKGFKTYLEESIFKDLFAEKLRAALSI